MSDRAKIIEETKKQILSLLVAFGTARDKPGISARVFHNDYRSMVGSAIPYRELGYPTLEDFFRDIPDAVSLTWNRGEALIKAVENENISHIVRLIDSQRKVPKKPRRRRPYPHAHGNVGVWHGGGYGGYPVRGYPVRGRASGRGDRPRAPFPDTSSAPVVCVEQPKPKDSSGFTQPPLQPKPPSSVRSEQPPAEPTVPATTRGMLRDLLISFPNGLLGSNIDLAFSRQFRQPLNPFKLGFHNMYHLFSSMQDLVEIEEYDDDFKVRQKRLAAKKLMDSFEQKEDRHPEKEAVKEVPSSKKTKEQSKQVLRTPRDYFDDDCGISSDLKEDIQKVLFEKPEGVWAAQFPSLFQETFGVPLPLKDIGCLSVIELMSKLTGIVTIVRASQRDWKLFDARIKSAEQEKDKTPAKQPDVKPLQMSTAPAVGELLQEMIRQVVSCYPHGLPMANLPDAFYEQTAKKLPVREMGYTNLESMLLQVPDVLHVEHTKEGLVLLHAKDSPSPFAGSLSLPKPAQEKPKVRKVPADAVGPGVHYPLLPSTEPGWKEVFVSTVNSPTHFWVQLKGTHTTEALEVLMDELEEFYYGPRSKEFTIPESMMAIGQAGVAIFPEDNNWHRVTIVSFKDLDYVEVFFVDYGGICSVHKENLRLLNQKFLAHPAQALQAKLANIVPAGPAKQWSGASSRRIFELTSNRPLIALVLGFTKERIMSLCLCDTNGSEDVHIQDVLVQEGHAAFEAEVQDDQGVSHGGEPNVPQILPGDNVAYVSPMKVSPYQSAENVEGVDADLNGLESQEPLPTCVQFVELTSNCNIHIIKYNNKAYVLSGEISSLLWEKDLLRGMLRQLRLEPPRVILPRAEHEDMFTEFEYYGVGGIKDGGDVMKSHVSMYELNSLPKILTTFSKPADDLMQAVQHQIEVFDPDDPYWQGEVDGEELRSCSEITEDSDSFSLGLSELEVAMEALQLRRKRIFESMVTVQDCVKTQNQVEQLQILERQITEVRKLIQQTKEDDSPVSTENRKKQCEEDAFIETCIAEQYEQDQQKPTAAVTGSTQPPDPRMLGNVDLSAQLSSMTLGNATCLPSSVSLPKVDLVNAFWTQAIALGAASAGQQTRTSPDWSQMMSQSMVNLTPQQHNFMLQYNQMLLQQQAMQTQVVGLNQQMLGMNMGRGALPMPVAMPSVSQQQSVHNLTDSLAQLTSTLGGRGALTANMGDLSTMLLNQGRGLRMNLMTPEQQPRGPPTGLQDRQGNR